MKSETLTEERRITLLGAESHSLIGPLKSELDIFLHHLKIRKKRKCVEKVGRIRELGCQFQRFCTEFQRLVRVAEDVQGKGPV